MNIPTTRETFSKKLVKKGDCLLWVGVRNNDGYGTSSMKSRTMLCHRIAWTLFVGPIPDGAHVLHRCDNPACCNVEHLFLGDHSINMRDMWQKNRHRRPNGERNNHAKLTAEQVVEIRERYQRRELGQVALAKEYGVSQANISCIVRGETWAS